jgi:tRNA-2-methylthio-N6-dimethylallyladenosine synthase
MNVYDSERMGDALSRDGYQPDDSTSRPRIWFMINTCHIREKAAEKVYSQLGRLAQLKKSAQFGKAAT